MFACCTFWNLFIPKRSQKMGVQPFQNWQHSRKHSHLLPTYNCLFVEESFSWKLGHVPRTVLQTNGLFPVDIYCARKTIFSERVKTAAEKMSDVQLEMIYPWSFCSNFFRANKFVIFSSRYYITLSYM